MAEYLRFWTLETAMRAQKITDDARFNMEVMMAMIGDLDDEPPADVGERDAVPEDFIGKTITGFDSSACNIWRFTFSDETSLAIEAEIMSVGNYGSGIPIMQICVPCGIAPPAEDEQVVA